MHENVGIERKACDVGGNEHEQVITDQDHPTLKGRAKTKKQRLTQD